MKKINKQQTEELYKLAGFVDDCHDEIMELVLQLNEKLEAYRNCADEFKSYVETLADEAQEYFDERSEGWQESENGTSYSEWIDAIRSSVDDLESPDDCDSYDDLERAETILESFQFQPDSL